MTQTWPFSPVRRANGLVYLTGEVAFDDEGHVPDGIEEQTRLTLQRIARTLEAEGLTLSDVVSSLVHLARKSDFQAYSAEYGRHFSAPYPVRTTVCAELVDDVLIEITVIAAERK